jgi:hypothetical protein
MDTGNGMPALTQADAASRKCTAAELTELVALLKRKGFSWADLVRSARWKPSSEMDDLHAVGHAWAMAFLAKQPDARERGKA